VDRGIAELAARQHGVVSSVQLFELGLTKSGIQRRLETGRLHRIYRGVYAVGHASLSPAGKELAAVLGCGPDAVSSHRAAGCRWGIVRSAARYEVTAPRSRNGPPGVLVHRSRRLDPADRAVVEAVPVTSMARTLVDLADVLSERRLADAVHEAEVQRIFDLNELRQAQARVPGRTGRHRLKRVLAAYEVPVLTRSEAERRFLDLCRTHSLPQPRTNAPLHGYEVDFYWPERNLVVEIDGAAAHHTRKAFQNDRRRDRALAKKHIQVLRVTWHDLDEGAADLAAILRR
jgi:very-short-patch-repair endonuclease